MPEHNSNKPLIIVGVLLICLIITIILIPKTIVVFSKANSNSSSTTALENSYLFASPIQAKADGQEKIRVTVFILDGRGLGVSNRTVTLNLPQTITNVHVQPITDEAGKAIFDLSSATQGTFNISAFTDNKEIPQKLRIVFY